MDSGDCSLERVWASRDLLPGTLCGVLQVRDDGALLVPVLRSGVPEERKDTRSAFSLCSSGRPSPPEPGSPRTYPVQPTRGTGECGQVTQLSVLSGGAMGPPGCPGGRAPGTSATEWTAPSRLPGDSAHGKDPAMGPPHPSPHPPPSSPGPPALNSPHLSAPLTRPALPPLETRSPTASGTPHLPGVPLLAGHTSQGPLFVPPNFPTSEHWRAPGLGSRTAALAASPAEGAHAGPGARPIGMLLRPGPAPRP